MGLGSLGAVQGMGRLRTPQNPHTWFSALQKCCPFFYGKRSLHACAGTECWPPFFQQGQKSDLGPE